MKPGVKNQQNRHDLINNQWIGRKNVPENQGLKTIKHQMVGFSVSFPLNQWLETHIYDNFDTKT